MIWCVEDDASIRDIEVYTLSSTGFDARGFADGVSFWAALQTEKPDLVVLDVMLPGMDGYEATRTIRSGANPLGRTIPIIAMTANAFAEDVKKSLDAGMNAHLSKPVDLNALEQTLQRFRYEPSAEQPQ